MRRISSTPRGLSHRAATFGSHIAVFRLKRAARERAVILRFNLPEICVAIVCMFGARDGRAQSNISATDKFAWGENIGWLNWRDANGTTSGVIVQSNYLQGFIWAENEGWINVGNGGGPYANTNGTNFGVNILLNGDLFGYAWGENCGWINFNTVAQSPNEARYDFMAGRCRGYAWGENVGWINLDDATHFVGAATGVPCAPPLQWGMAAQAPSTGIAPAMAYDSARQRTVWLGFGATWEWNGVMWLQMNPVNAPPQTLASTALAYDSARGLTVLFGGYDFTLSAPTGNTWVWNGNNWMQVSSPGLGNPAVRSFPALAYDVGNGVTVLFGGYDNNTGTSYNDTWEWNGFQWTQRFPALPLPPARSAAAMAYDAVRGVVVMYGGASAAGVPFNDTWEWNGTNWTQRLPANNPGARVTHKMAYDSVRGVTVLYGGNNWPANSGTWEWDGTTWTQTGNSAPGLQSLHDMVYDFARRQIVLADGSLANTWVYPSQSVNNTVAYWLPGGTSNGTGWSWCISTPASSVCNLNTPGVPAGLPPSAVTAQFVNSIRAIGCQGLSANSVPSAPNTFLVTIGGTQPYTFCVGGVNQQPNCCMPPSSSCPVNPLMTQIDLSGVDCDGNLTDDAIDIAAGTLEDLDGNGIPDVCECVPGIYGDIAPPPDGDGFVDVGDVLCCLDGFADAGLCPVADIAPCGGDGTIDVGDVLAVLGAFAGEPACPDPCE